MTEACKAVDTPTPSPLANETELVDEHLPLDAALSRGDLNWVVDALEARRDEVLERWTTAVSEQPFHAGRRERAVTDDIPKLYDALLTFLRMNAAPWQDAGAPLDDPSVLSAAQSHARARAEQGLQPNEIVAELRLLRREVWRALRMEVAEQAPHRDVISTELLLNDAIDGAITVGLSALSARVEELREDFLVTTVHEVRQPITAIKGTAQFAHRLLSRSKVDLEQLGQVLKQIDEHADRMNELLETLTDSSRAALGQLELSYADADLRRISEEAIATLDTVTAARVQLAVHSTAPLAGRWDGLRLRQVLTNLLTNAVKYSPDGTPIEVTIEGD
jgi:signal transduction histidine kinase